MPPPIATNTLAKKIQLTVQPNPNLNNTKQHAQQQSYAISLNDIHLRSGTTLPAPQNPIITKFEDPPTEHIDDSNQKTYLVAKEPPFPHRLIEQSQPAENHPVIDFFNQLKQMTIKIPLLDVIKEVHAYIKVIKEACIKQPRRKKKDPKTIHVIG